MSDRIADPWGTAQPLARGDGWVGRVDSFLDEGLAAGDIDTWVQSACVLCSNGCGLDIAVKDGRMVGVRGRADDHVNRGRLGPKGLFGWQANASADRLTRPLVRGGDGELHETDWETAMGTVAERSRQLLDERGPSSHAFYNSGQLFIEDYYTLALITKGGIGTPHTDGNTRLCTATAAQALKETFGCDGQPACYEDVNHADTFFLVGHNVAETETVLWMRIRDRLEGPDRPSLIVVDPRLTVPAAMADVHLAPKNGTNLALLNAILNELISTDRVDHGFVDAHTVGFDALTTMVSGMPVERAATICGLDPDEIRHAASLIGEADALLSTCLQGVYQSHQATASAVQVNNINLVRGMIGRPGCGILQMNGQPTAQNTRETGVNGDMAGFRNWQNEQHMQELAELWNVDMLQVPHWGPPTHAMEIFRYAEEGAIGFLWVIATNPAVSMPELGRIRQILSQDRLFLVVQDPFLTETARLADVVLPAAIWGEKTGTFTNADRTVHLSERAIDPPGEARPDLDIFLDYARRMAFTDKDGAPLVPWSTPEAAFEAWKACSKGRPCDYSGMSYELLRSRSGLHWPYPEGATEEVDDLYSDLEFPTKPDYCEDFGHDLLTGAALEEKEYRAVGADGRAILKAAEYTPSPDAPDDTYPYLFTTGRTLYQFHTRTKTGRSRQLQDAAPEVWVELAAADAEHEGIGEGDLVEVTSAQGRMQGRARITGTRPGVVFAPFHYGYWDVAKGAGPEEHAPRAANELTVTRWDPVSKQPTFKVAAVKITRVATGDGSPSPAPTTTASAPVGAAVAPTTGGPAAEATETVTSGEGSA
jgi:anaerobic selenocysteine-containing dehydrogenase